MKDLFNGIFLVLAIPLCIGIMIFAWLFLLRNIDVNLLPALSILLFALPILLPITLFYLTYDRWVAFVQTMYIYNQGRATLRIKLPPEVLKSPEAMESVLRQIHNTSKADNLMQAYLDGKSPLWNSLELVSIGGDVRFYINVPRKKMKNLVESQLYAQYPGIEVFEEPVDYAAELQWKDDFAIMSFHIVKAEDEVLPIRTYIDMKLDQLPKEEEKVEPMAPLIEYLSTVQPHERVVFQILCEPHVKKTFSLGTSLKETPTWRKAAQKKVNEIMYRDEKRLSIRSEDEEEPDARPSLTMGERDLVAAIERNTCKLAYRVGIRATYITLDENKFNADNITFMLKAFFPYDDESRNKMGVRWKTDFDYKLFEDFSGTRVTARKKAELEQLKSRTYDAGGGKGNDIHQPKVMSVEELATIYHIPGSAVVTPGLARIPSSKTSAPANLPIGDLPI